ncbi:MAG TPA: hypothetical protein VKE74_27630, partial [Gemmataceae bacterium]|nr:hypothetical protein [Gemmataceae bacterium]
MTTKTLKTLVLKTATVGSVKLSTPADRIGLGLMVVAKYPTEVLSQGQFPLPSNPEPNRFSGSRQALSVAQMHEQMRAMATAVPPAGSAGCLGVPGCSVLRSVWPLTGSREAGWQVEAKRAGRASSHAGAGLLHRSGSDCQSPDRS